MLELDRVRKLYESPGELVYAVEEVTMHVQAREFVAIFGPSGSGKTTLLQLASGWLKPDGGSVRFEGSDLAQLSKQDRLAYRRCQLGFVSQSFNLVAGMSAAENVALPLLLRDVKHREARRRALATLDAVGLRLRSDHMPERLSGGEQQRVAIARALAGKPKLILADEPTGSLDSETGDAALDLLSELPREQGAAAIIVTHDTRVARYADRVLGMRDGRLVEPDLQAQPTVLRE
jgi:putative ABC transport system ATP-binding protein